MEFCRTTWFCSLVFSLWFCFVHVAMSLNCQGCVSAAAAADVSSLLPKVQTVQLFATSGALVLLIVLWIPLDPLLASLGKISWENLFGSNLASHVLLMFLLSSCCLLWPIFPPEVLQTGRQIALNLASMTFSKIDPPKADSGFARKDKERQHTKHLIRRLFYCA